MIKMRVGLLFLRDLNDLHRNWHQGLQGNQLGELNDSSLGRSNLLHHVRAGVLGDDVVALSDLQDVFILHVAEAVGGLTGDDSGIFLLVNIHMFINVGNFLVTNSTGNLVTFVDP